jgi:hypothetical protein
MRAQGAKGFFTGIEPEEWRLPHPHIDIRIILLVRRVIIQAFAMLRDNGYPLADEQEDPISTALCNIIENNLRQKGTVQGFDRRHFERVVRHGPVENYSFMKLKTAPDLCFTLVVDEEPGLASSYHALFVECKPIDREHAAGGDYCDKGLQRFVDGEYAWAMQEALMLGYARHGRSISDHLVRAMNEPERRARLKVVEPPRPVLHAGAEAAPHADVLYRSRHRRGFSWPDDKGPAVDIVVYHSWHCCA